MSAKTVELSVLLSLFNGYEVLDVTPQDVTEVVSHVHGIPKEGVTGDLVEQAIEYIEQKHPKVAEAARLVAHLPPDEGRYNKLIDLFRKWFHIEPMIA
jgi:hypothetical protein